MIAKTKKNKPVGGTLEDWSFWYEESAGEKIRPDSREHVLFDPNRGFMSFLIYPEEREFYGHYVAGDGRFWVETAKTICKAFNLDTIQFYTRHDPNLVERLTGAKVKGYLMEIKLEQEEGDESGRVKE